MQEMSVTGAVSTALILYLVAFVISMGVALLIKGMTVILHKFVKEGE